jgi:hypothetical protein
MLKKMNDFTKEELCRICCDNTASMDDRLTQFPGFTVKEPCPTCDECKELWLKKLSEFLKENNEGSGIYTYSNGRVKEISEDEWMDSNPNASPLRYGKK